MYLTIRGVVLRVTDYNDRDALLTVLSQAHGKLTVKARGLRRKNSPLTAPCQLLAYGEFTLFEYRGQYTINEARSLELFQGLRRELTRQLDEMRARGILIRSCANFAGLDEHWFRVAVRTEAENFVLLHALRELTEKEGGTQWQR